MSEHVRVTYRIESHHSLEHAAEVLAGEQSSGTFVAVAGETPELKRRHGARVVDVRVQGTREAPSLPGTNRPKGSGEDRVVCGEIVIDFPLENFGVSLPNLLAAAAGNLFELRELGAIRLMDLELPEVFRERYPGPAFGVSGTRELMGVPEGVMVGSIIKPSVGLTPEDLRPIVRALVEGGVNFIKDDELIANPPYSPLADRVRVVMEEVERGAQRSGRKVMYAFNITDDLDRLQGNHDLVVEAGGTCVMACVNLIGLAGLTELRRHSQVPIHGHRTMLGAMMRHPALGFEFRAYQKLVRLAGADHLHTNGLGNKFYERDEEVLASIRAVREPFLGGYEMVPVLSSAQWAGTAAATFAQVASTDLLVVAGGGIAGHPDGVAAGMQSMREAWDAAQAGIPLEQHALEHPALARAIEHFGAPLAVPERPAQAA